MTAALTTWDGAGDLGDGVLFIVNSSAADRAEADAAFDRVYRSCRAGPFVIAPVCWLDWVRTKAVAEGRTLIAQNARGESVDLNQFLIGGLAFRWIESNRIRVVVGSSPHELHNYEVKEVFEQRIAVFIRDGVFIAHALPSPYIYILDLPHLLRRMSRRLKTETFLSTSHAMVDDWYRLWQARACPATAAAADIEDAVAVVRRHFGDAILSDDEDSPVSLAEVDNLGGAATYVRSLHEIVLAYEAAYAERAEAVIIREREVVLRDTIIDGLHQTIENTPSRRLRRWIKHVVLPTNRND